MSTSSSRRSHTPHLTMAASRAWYWDRPRQPQTVKDFAFDLYQGHPQDIDGLTHREENAVYHIFDKDGYRTLPEDALKLDL